MNKLGKTTVNVKILIEKYFKINLIIFIVKQNQRDYFHLEIVKFKVLIVKKAILQKEILKLKICKEL